MALLICVLYIMRKNILKQIHSRARTITQGSRAFLSVTGSRLPNPEHDEKRATVAVIQQLCVNCSSLWFLWPALTNRPHPYVYGCVFLDVVPDSLVLSVNTWIHVFDHNVRMEQRARARCSMVSHSTLVCAREGSEVCLKECICTGNVRSH